VVKMENKLDFGALACFKASRIFACKLQKLGQNLIRNL